MPTSNYSNVNDKRNDTVLLRYVSLGGVIKLPTITRRVDPTAGYVQNG
jgi:hypothetical protein